MRDTGERSCCLVRPGFFMRGTGERSCCLFRPGFFMRGTGERSCCRPGFFMRGTGERSCCLLLLIDTFFIATLFYLTIKIIHRKTLYIYNILSVS